MRMRAVAVMAVPMMTVVMPTPAPLAMAILPSHGGGRFL
jgi:hypothetical protein